MQRDNETVNGSGAGGAKRRTSRAGATVLLACAVGASLLWSVFTGALPPVAGFVAVALVLTAVFWQIRAHLPSILLVFVAVMLAGVVVTHRLPKLRADRTDARDTGELSRKWAASGRFNESLPIVVHLIFDELMSTGGMTDDVPGGDRTRQRLLEFGRKHSFRIYDSVYSRYWTTGGSIPNLMNREYLGRTGLDSLSPFPFDRETRSFSLETNAYFDDMANRGYRTVVFQVPFMNFCANRNVDMCETFDSFDPGGADSAIDSPTLRVNLWQTVLRAYAPSYTSSIGQKIVARVYALGSGEVGVEGFVERYDAQRFPQWFDRFTRFTAAVPRGTHVFAHFLVPHSPYLLTESCVVSGNVEAGYYLSQAGTSRDERWRHYYERYLGQVRCVENKLDSFMAAIGQSENFRDAVIVIHGDHGSRISSGDVLEDYSRRDFVDNYATFFAVRSPVVQPGVDCEFVSLSEVFRRYAARGVPSRPRPAAPLPVIVYSRAAGNAEVEAPMPPFGCAAGTASLSE
ncbi:MAG TPA: sulfatase-like hydrolase/transferase [Thermoanaerobaculia bacterium]|nr:sulfatase-like hydrolase/transferase [Thermoanaerobaculia bacterium]